MTSEAPKSIPPQSAPMVRFADVAADRSPHALHVLSLCRPGRSHLHSHCPSVFSLGLHRVCHSFVGYANSVASDKFVRTEADPGFPLIGGLKDVGHMQQLGKDSGAAMPVVDIIMQHMRQVCSRRLLCTASYIQSNCTASKDSLRGQCRRRNSYTCVHAAAAAVLQCYLVIEHALKL